MRLAYTAQLGLKVQKTDVDTSKINRSLLATYGMVIAAFQVLDMLGCSWFFQETFLLANISMEVVLGILFLTLSNVNIQFTKKELTWRTYTTKEALPTTRLVKLINWKEFAKAALDENIEAFLMHVSFLRSKMTIHPVRKAWLALLLAKKVTVLVEYLDFANVFLEMSANVFLEQTKVNEHAIELEEAKQPPYGPIDSLKPIEFKTFKTYIETNLAKNFIRTSKSPAGAPILFVRKPNDSFCLCVDYQRLNNLTIKNGYPLPLIGESLDWLGQAKQFTQLDLTSAYHSMRIKEGDE